MPSFICKAINNDGEAIEEHREAVDKESLILALQDEGYIPIQVVLASTKSFAWLNFKPSVKVRIGQKEMGVFTRELATLLGAGLPLDRSLTVLISLTDESSQLNLLIQEVLEKVRGGTNLSDALEAQAGVFSRFYLNMIRAGEAGGGLEGVLVRLSEYIERSKELRETVSTALIYPIILIVMSIASVFLLLIFVVPQFTEMFDSAGKELPLPTQVVVGTAEWLQSYWWIILLSIIAFSSYMRFQLADISRRYVWDERFLRIPLVGDLICKMEIASFSRTLGTLLGNGVSLLGGLSIVKETLTNRVLADKVGLAADRLKEGGEMTEPLLESALFPKMAMQMIKLGEETGKLEEMLDRVAAIYDKEIEITVQRMLALLEPVLIVGLGIVIAGIIMSILMAILSINDLAF